HRREDAQEPHPRARRGRGPVRANPLRPDQGAHHLPVHARPGRPGAAVSLAGVTAPQLILASASPRRRDLLARLGVEPARVTYSGIDEAPHKGELPRDYAARMAREKALAAADPGAYVLAGATVVAVGRRILPKAEDEATARACLDLLSGRRHRVLSAVALLAPDGAMR